MTVSWAPTWELVLKAAERLSDAAGEFRLQDLVAEVQRTDPDRGYGTITPVVQGMTINAGKGPPSPCGKPLVRTGHGWYTLADDVVSPASADNAALPIAHVPSAGTSTRRTNRDAEVAARVAGVIATFPECVAGYDRLVPFNRTGQYETHRAAIDRRLRSEDVAAALQDDEFLSLLYHTLRRWGIGVRGSRLVPLAEFRQKLWDQAGVLSALESLRIDDPALDVAATARDVWSVIENLGVVENKSLIVPGTKTLHHLLPDLVPPMDRAWTGAFFLWSAAAPQYAQATTFTRTFTALAHIAQATQPTGYVGDGWRTSRTKILDNAIVGYCKINNIRPAGS